MTIGEKILGLFAVSSDEDISAEVSFRMSFTNVVNFALLFYSLVLGLDALFSEVLFVAVTNLLFSLLFVSYFVVTYLMKRTELWHAVNMLVVFVYFIVAYTNGGFLGYAGQPLIIYPFVAMVLHGRRVGAYLSLAQMSVLGLYYLALLAGIIPFECSYSVHELINSAILQCAGICIYYIAIRWISSLIYDKIHEVSQLNDELRVKGELVTMLTDQLVTPIKDIEKIAYRLGDEQLTMAQQDMLSMVKASTANVMDNIEAITKASKFNVRPIPKEEVVFNVYLLICNVMELYSSKEHRAKHSVVMSSEVPQKLFGNSILCRQILLSCFDSLSRKMKVQELPMKIIVSLSDILQKGINIHFAIEIEEEVSIDHRDLSTLESKLVETLDLDVMRRLVVASDGEFLISSEHNKLTIEFTLPYVDADLMMASDLPVANSMSSSMSMMSEVVPMSEAKVLVVDDNLLNQKIISMFISGRVKSVVTASGGREALAMFENSRFDVVLMDLQMPDMDGFVTTKKIREIEAGLGHRVPIIAVGATLNDDSERRCMEVGMDAYIFKPFKADDLIRTMQSYLG